ncbi:MAG: Mo-dependent nitrogenase C-terminal domain-containing protein [Elainellaceae cyanobacterium]
MTNITYAYSPEQTSAWLRGLSTIAWADGHFDEEEQAVILSLAQTEIAPRANPETLESIDAQALADAIGPDGAMGENFMRTAVMVAIADGIYSPAEDEILQQFCDAMHQPHDILNHLRMTLPSENSAASDSPLNLEPLRPVREWLDHLDIESPGVARFLCKMIPPQCPFERDVNLFGRKLIHIPPLCKLNPLYEQLVGLRFRALSYLADDCGEDVSQYC